MLALKCTLLLYSHLPRRTKRVGAAAMERKLVKWEVFGTDSKSPKTVSR